MMRVERHPQVDADVDEALAYTLHEFGPDQVPVYEHLIVEGLRTLRRHPTIGQLRADIGPGIRVFCIARPGIKAPHGYVRRSVSNALPRIEALTMLLPPPEGPDTNAGVEAKRA